MMPMVLVFLHQQRYLSTETAMTPQQQELVSYYHHTAYIHAYMHACTNILHKLNLVVL